MFKIQSVLVGVLVAALAGPVAAHGNHEQMEPINKTQATAVADQVVGNLLTQQKLHESWQKAASPQITRRQTPNGAVWVARYTNPQEKDAAKQSLYIFVDEMGNVMNANHDGKM